MSVLITLCNYRPFFKLDLNPTEEAQLIAELRAKGYNILEQPLRLETHNEPQFGEDVWYGGLRIKYETAAAALVADGWTRDNAPSWEIFYKGNDRCQLTRAPGNATWAISRKYLPAIEG